MAACMQWVVQMAMFLWPVLRGQCSLPLCVPRALSLCACLDRALLLFCLRYDPGSDQWMAVTSMAVHRKHLGVSVLDGILYAVGGRNEATELSSVER